MGGHVIQHDTIRDGVHFRSWSQSFRVQWHSLFNINGKCGDLTFSSDLERNSDLFDQRGELPKNRNHLEFLKLIPLIKYFIAGRLFINWAE